MIGDCHTAALISKTGSIDWLCLPRFDSGACFAALLGSEEHGFWRLHPRTAVTTVRRRYRGETLVLETEFHTDTGSVAIIDCMPVGSAAVDLVRIVEGRSGCVPMRSELVVRFDYGSVIPWVTREDRELKFIAGPDTLHWRSPVDSYGRHFRTYADFEVRPGERVPFVLTYHPSHRSEPARVDAEAALHDCEQFWLEWSSRSTYQGRYREAVQRSLLTLKALTYAPTGGIVAAPTTSLPEDLGGVRNWDYRFCWVRDATITLYALMSCGYQDEAREWREWLLRAVAGSPQQLQIMYGIAGERRLDERELGWLPGYENSRPVRIGNAAFEQLQLDVWGELMGAMYLCRTLGMENLSSWNLERGLLEWLESNWQLPDEGIWESRGGKQHFTHSKVMAWAAFDRGIRTIERFGRTGPMERWRQHRKAIFQEVCQRGYDRSLGSFTQYYGSKRVDASLLLIGLVGFLPASDSRVQGTVAAVQRELQRDGFVLRYLTDNQMDGLPGPEGAFLACTLWLADNLVLLGRRGEAEQLFEQVLAVSNDVGLLSEEYDLGHNRMVGNFPQAFSHLSLVNTAQTLAHPEESPVQHRDPTRRDASFAWVNDRGKPAKPSRE